MEERGINGVFLLVAQKFYGDVCSAAGDDTPCHAVRARRREVIHRMAVHLKDFVAGLQTGLRRRAVGLHPANRRALVGFTCGLANFPDDGGKDDRQQKTEQRPGEGHDDFVERRDVRKLLGFFVGLALNGFHRRHLRQRDVAAERNRAEGVFHAVEFFLPDGFAEPDGEALHFQAAPARREEMSEFMHPDNEVEQQHHFQRDQEIM